MVQIVWSINNDKRITRLGKFLRKYRLEELPQLISVIKGDMSIVGPRPHAKEVDKEFRKEIYGYMQRYRFKPGITGLAQINGRNSISWNDRFIFDVRYVKNKSFFLDLKILLLTFL